jgi:hypothetical protein
MGALKIDCYCNEHQMQEIVNYTHNYLNYTDHLNISDIDREFDNIRVCISFEVFMDTLRLKSAEVLDADWDLLYEDTAVLNSRLHSIIRDHNHNHTELTAQARQIRKEYAF